MLICRPSGKFTCFVVGVTKVSSGSGESVRGWGWVQTWWPTVPMADVFRGGSWVWGRILKPPCGGRLSAVVTTRRLSLSVFSTIRNQFLFHRVRYARRHCFCRIWQIRMESWHGICYAVPSVFYLSAAAGVREGSVSHFCGPSGIVQLSHFGVLWFYSFINS